MQWVNFSSPSVTQDAIAKCLVRARQPFEGHDSFYSWLAADYKKRRAFLSGCLREAGIDPIEPQGGFFICADTTDLAFPDSVYQDESLSSPQPMPRDWALARHMTHTNPKVCVIPPSPFYSPENVGQVSGSEAREATSRGGAFTDFRRLYALNNLPRDSLRSS